MERQKAAAASSTAANGTTELRRRSRAEGARVRKDKVRQRFFFFFRFLSDACRQAAAPIEHTFPKTPATTNAMLFNHADEANRARSTGLVVGSQPDMCCSRGDLKTATTGGRGNR